MCGRCYGRSMPERRALASRPSDRADRRLAQERCDVCHRAQRLWGGGRRAALRDAAGRVDGPAGGVDTRTSGAAPAVASGFARMPVRASSAQPATRWPGRPARCAKRWAHPCRRDGRRLVAAGRPARCAKRRAPCRARRDGLVRALDNGGRLGGVAGGGDARERGNVRLGRGSCRRVAARVRRRRRCPAPAPPFGRGKLLIRAVWGAPTSTIFPVHPSPQARVARALGRGLPVLSLRARTVDPVRHGRVHGRLHRSRCTAGQAARRAASAAPLAPPAPRSRRTGQHARADARRRRGARRRSARAPRPRPHLLPRRGRRPPGPSPPRRTPSGTFPSRPPSCACRGRPAAPTTGPRR